jgi:hypothetical protein
MSTDIVYPETGYWIPNVNAVEIPNTRKLHLELTNNETGTVQLLIPNDDAPKARFYGLMNGGITFPGFDTLHLKSIDIDHDFAFEDESNSNAYYRDVCVRATLNYTEWQMPNQGFESNIDDTSHTISLPIYGYYGNPLNPAVPGYPILGSTSAYITRSAFRITRTYTGRLSNPSYIAAYNNTLNQNMVSIPEWGLTIAPLTGLFKIGQYEQKIERDWNNSDPTARIPIFTYSYSIEVMDGTWESLPEPFTGQLVPIYDNTGARIYTKKQANWSFGQLLE